MTERAAGRILRIADLPPGEAAPPPADRLLGGDPRPWLRNLYSDPAGRFHVGHWASTPGAWRVEYSETEFCCLLSGRVRLRAESGEDWTFGAGESFLIEKGFRGEWAVLEACAKLYAIYEG